jgi:hypothetical protein
MKRSFAVLVALVAGLVGCNSKPAPTGESNPPEPKTHVTKDKNGNTQTITKAPD